MDGNKLRPIKILFLLLPVFALGYGIWVFRSGNFMTIAELRGWITGYGMFAPLVFILMYGLLVTFGFPAVICSTVGGLVFGRFYGTALNLWGASLGASGAFWIARLIARDFIAKKFASAKWFNSFSKGIEKDGFYYMLFVRLLPIFPFNGINYASGITNIRYRYFLLATMLCMLPYDFALTNTVVEVGEAAANGFKMSPGLIAALSLLAFISLVPIRIKKYIERQNAEKAAKRDLV
jgi:uncharacterized membrane protein YdjX (TVP38/TMEM64 family)